MEHFDWLSESLRQKNIAPTIPRNWQERSVAALKSLEKSRAAGKSKIEQLAEGDRVYCGRDSGSKFEPLEFAWDWWLVDSKYWSYHPGVGDPSPCADYSDPWGRWTKENGLEGPRYVALKNHDDYKTKTFLV